MTSHVYKKKNRRKVSTVSRETAENREEGQAVTHEPIILEIPSRSEYVLLARLVVTQAGQVAGFGPEDIYDLKLAITEAVTNAIRHARVASIKIEYLVRPQEVEISVIDAGGGFDAESIARDPNNRGGFGLAVIGNLVDEVALDSGSGGTRLTMIRRISSSV